MSIFEVQVNGKTFEVEAPSLRAAITAVNQMGPSLGLTNQAMPSAEGSAASRFFSNAGELLNPVTMATGLYQAVAHPVKTGEAMLSAQGEQFTKAGDALRRASQAEGWIGKTAAASEAVGHGMAGMLPVLGPIAAEAGEQMQRGDIAGGAGKATGLLLPTVGIAPLVRGARAAMSPATREAAAASLESGAARRVTDVMSPKIGPNKTRFGNQAEKVAPQIAKDMAENGAPFTREGLHAQVGERLALAESALDEAADARLAARTFETQPMIEGLLDKRRQLTAESVEGARNPRTPRERTSPILDERGQPITVTEQRAVPIGEDVVPGPNAARVAVIDQAIGELRQLGPVTRYEPIRRMRQAYDGPAKTIYSPSMTADYLKAQGGKLGAADVTGTLRETLAQWDPATAEANSAYSTYRAANDVLEATREIERTRPRVGRQIAARVFGAMAGGRAAGAPGAVAGYLGGPLIDQAVSSGFTTQLKTANAMSKLATAIRAGDMERVNGILSGLGRAARRTAPTTGLVQAGRVTGQTNTEPALAVP